MDAAALPLLRPDWPAPPGVGAAFSTRLGGVSGPPFDSLNFNVEDDPQALAGNLARLRSALGAEPVLMRQVHGVEVVRLNGPTLPRALCADAAVTTEVGLACTVLVADCLPVLMCDLQGRAVAAAHAGWRGLAAGVLERTVAALQDAAGCRPSEVLAWLGPCIGAQAFEVGSDVLETFGVPPRREHAAGLPHFHWSPRPDGQPRWRADLRGLATDRLRAVGVQRIEANGDCTLGDPLRFFSFRRDGRTGRMAACIWRRGLGAGG